MMLSYMKKLKQIIRLSILLSSIVVLFVLSTAAASAATITWDGEGAGDTDWSTAANWSGDTIPGASDDVVFDATSSNNSVIDAGHAGSVLSISVNSGYGGEITQSRSLTVGAGGFTQATGTFTGGSAEIDINGSLTMTGGTFTATSGNMYILDVFDNSAGGTFNHNDGTVLFDQATGTQTWDFASTENFYNFTLATGASAKRLQLASSDTMTVENDYTINDGQFYDNSNNKLYIQGDLTWNTDGDHQSIDYEFTGGNTQNVSYNLTANYKGINDWIINKSGGTMELQAKVDMNNLTVSSATTINNTAQLRVVSDITMDAGTLNIGGGTFYSTHSSSDYTINTGATFNAGTETSTLYDLIIAGGTFNSSTGLINQYGSFTISSGTFNHNNGTWDMRQANNTILDVASAVTFYDFGLNKSNNARTLTLGSGDTITIANDLTLTNGNLVGGGDMVAQGDVTVVSTLDSATTALSFTGTSAQAFTLTGATGLYDGDITINKASGTVTLGSDLVMDASTQDLTITSGTLASGNNDISLSGNWSNSGTFTPGTGAVIFTDAGGTSTISGSTTFYDFTCTTDSKVLNFTNGTTQAVTNAFTITGSDGSLVSLYSDSAGDTWGLNLSGTSAVDYGDVKDSDASSGSEPTHTNSTDSGNNTNWGFNDGSTVTSVTGTQVLDGTGYVTITAIFDDPDDDVLTARAYYSIDGGSNWEDPTLGASPTATFGTPAVTNEDVYQVSALPTASGENTLTVIWQSASDVASTTDVANAQFRFTPNDGTVDGTTGTSSNFALDINAPSVPTISFPEEMDAETTFILITGAEPDSNLYSNGADTGIDITSSGSYNLEVTVVRFATNSYSITTVDAAGNVSTPTTATIEGTAASGGTFTTIAGDPFSIAGDVEIESSGLPEGIPTPTTPGEELVEEPVEEPIDEAIATGISEGLLELDLVSLVEGHLCESDVKLFNSFFKPELALTRLETLETAMYIFDLSDKDIQENELLALAFSHGIIIPYTNGSFRSEELATKAEAIKMILEASELDIPLTHAYTESPIVDVHTDDWSAKYIFYAYDNDLIELDKYGRYGKTEDMTRAEFSKIVKKIKLLNL